MHLRIYLYSVIFWNYKKCNTWDQQFRITKSVGREVKKSAGRVEWVEKSDGSDL